ncbi:hypothetical protein D3C71_1769220 [compost metagenome]
MESRSSATTSAIDSTGVGEGVSLSMMVAVPSARAIVALALGVSSWSLKFSTRPRSLVSANAVPSVMRTVLTISPAANVSVPVSAV